MLSYFRLYHTICLTLQRIQLKLKGHNRLGNDSFFADNVLEPPCSTLQCILSNRFDSDMLYNDSMQHVLKDGYNHHWSQYSYGLISSKTGEPINISFTWNAQLYNILYKHTSYFLVTNSCWMWKMWFSTARRRIFPYQSYDIAIAGIPYKNASLAPATVPE